MIDVAFKTPFLKVTVMSIKSEEGVKFEVDDAQQVPFYRYST